VNVVGLDLGLTATGYASLQGSGTVGPKLRGVQRLSWFYAWVERFARADLVVIEDYAFHGHMAHSHELGELGGVIRLRLLQLGVTFVAIVPSSLKLYATGKGNAKKEAVLAEAIRRLGYDGSDHNEADALWLRAMGMEAMGAPVVAMPAVHRKALDKVDWPAIVEASSGSMPMGPLEPPRVAAPHTPTVPPVPQAKPSRNGHGGHPTPPAPVALSGDMAER
jgi:Holliday junction resolvasome RuvABC endonuclease subunit